MASTATRLARSNLPQRVRRRHLCSKTIALRTSLKIMPHAINLGLLAGGGKGALSISHMMLRTLKGCQENEAPISQATCGRRVTER